VRGVVGVLRRLTGSNPSIRRIRGGREPHGDRGVPAELRPCRVRVGPQVREARAEKDPVRERVADLDPPARAGPARAAPAQRQGAARERDREPRDDENELDPDHATALAFGSLRESADGDVGPE
jgi:hypothetical protein